jgi:hypothetical protein
MRRLLLAILLATACHGDDPGVGPRVAVGADGSLSLRLLGEPGVALEGLSFRLRADGSWLTVEDFDAPESAGTPAATTVTFQGDAAEVVLHFGAAFDEPGGPVVISPSVTPGRDLKLEALELTVPPGGLRLPGLAGELLFLQNGYQSWSFTGALRLEAPFASPVASRGEQALGGGLGDPIRSEKGVGWWLGVLASDPRGPGLAVGAGAARRRRTAILPALPAEGQGALAVRVGTAGEQTPVAAGATVTLEPVVLVADPSPARALARYVAEAARLGDPPLRREQVADPTGWWSWNIFFDKVTEAQVLDHAALLRDKLEPRGFSLVELDDGYELKWGEWEAVDRARFPSGLSGLSEKVRAMGLDVGLWLAPFLVDETATLAIENPGWFVKDEDGRPLRHSQLGVRGTALVLDPTHPGAAAHLGGLFGRLAKAGFTLFKLDFLYAGALPGRRHRAEVTGIEALRLGLELIREAAPGAHINLCGMPVLPAVGRGHSLRFGTDVAFTVAQPGLGQIAHEARNVMLRAPLDPLIRNDPDQVLLRPPLTLGEARAAATLGAMAGFYTSGDDLTALPAARLALLTHPTLLAIAGRARSAAPLDLLGQASAELYISPVVDPGLWSNQPRTRPPTRFFLDGEDGAPAYLALFNWETTEQALPVDLASLGRDATGVTVRDVFGGRTLEARPLSVRVEPHSVVLLEIAE